MEGVILIGILFAVCVALYLAPSLFAAARNHHNSGAIFVLNLFAGWTFLGWLIALVWACTSSAPAQIVVINNPDKREGPVGA